MSRINIGITAELFGKHSAVITNVPGPSEKLEFAGTVFEEVQMMLTNLIPQISIISYAGYFYSNMVLEKANFENADSLPSLWEEEIAALSEDLMGPPGEGPHVE